VTSSTSRVNPPHARRGALASRQRGCGRLTRHYSNRVSKCRRILVEEEEQQEEQAAEEAEEEVEEEEAAAEAEEHVE